MRRPWIRFSPQTVRKLQRFRRIKRGYYSFVILCSLAALSLFLEVLVSDRALIVRYEGDWFFPSYSRVRLGSHFGLTDDRAFVPVDYRKLRDHFRAQDTGNWVLLPLVPFSPYANHAYEGVYKPAPPGFDQHWLGTDTSGRDIVARLTYGFRTAIFFAVAFTAMVFALGVAIGCAMGYYGGWADLLGQRLIEIWANVPFLFTVIIVFSVVPNTLGIPVRIGILLLVMVAFSWTGLTYYMRTATYREKAREYVAAAMVLGAGSGRIIFRHVLPNTIALLVTFMPFTVVSAITAITALDFLGFGLPPPTPSIGEILKQGTARLDSPWIVTSAFVTLVLVLTLVTFVGEAVREAFDPKKFTVYQ